MKYVYDKNNNEIIGIYSDNVDVMAGLLMSESAKANLDYIQIDINFKNYKYYKVDTVNHTLVKRPDQEIQDIQQYGRILTEEERLNILLQPTYEETAKAEVMLETLALLQEVGLI